ncbi:hypothetical protein SDC9_114372 [bioreactor metagenome]|uniref:Uncharacterized protein n=1 Tax=bioreactor metagenome TaxID=1076179 RepID=A0A645BPS8_9ZZZZ
MTTSCETEKELKKQDPVIMKKILILTGTRVLPLLSFITATSGKKAIKQYPPFTSSPVLQKLPELLIWMNMPVRDKTLQQQDIISGNISTQLLRQEWRQG